MRERVLLLSGDLFATTIAVQQWVSKSPIISMLIQFPLLGAAGFVLGQHVSLPKKWVDVAVVFGIVTVLLGDASPIAGWSVNRLENAFCEVHNTPACLGGYRLPWLGPVCTVFCGIRVIQWS